MKHLFLIIVAILSLCISCKGKSSVSVSNDSLHDSIIAINDDKSLEFLKNIGIAIEPLVMADTFPQETHNPSSLPLTIEQQRKLLSDVVFMDVPDSILEIEAFLVTASAINENVAMCLYYIHSIEEPEEYIVTYDNAGKMIDAVFIGWGDEEDEIEHKSSDSTLLKSTNKAQTIFIGPHEFTRSRQYEETEHNITSNQDSTTYIAIFSMTYNIEYSGKITMTLKDNYEDGIFRSCSGSNSKEGWNLYNEMQLLIRYPYSDKRILEEWNELGNKVNGATDESFEYYFFKYAFMPQSEKVLKWIYENREYKSLTLTQPLGFYYRYTPESKQFIDKAISNLGNPAARAYYDDLTKLWLSDSL